MKEHLLTVNTICGGPTLELWAHWSTTFPIQAPTLGTDVFD